MRSVRAMVLKFRGTNDKEWLRFRLCNCSAVGVVFVFFVSRHMCLVLLIVWCCVLACLFTCVFCACIVDSF